MAYVALGSDRYAFDVFVSPRESVTGKAIRFRIRRSCPADKAKALDAEITHAVFTRGTWSPATSEVLGVVGIPASAPAKPNTRATIADALDLAWNDSEDGWKNARAGKRQYENARDVVLILGAHRPCSSITKDDYGMVRTALHEKGNSEATITRKLQAFYRTLHHAEAQGWIKTRPKFKRRKLNNARRFTFSELQEQQCIAYFRANSGMLKGMDELFIAGIDGGFRLNEILTLTGDRVDPKTRLVFIPDEQAKNGEFRQVVITERLADILSRRMEQNGKGLLFPGWSARTVSDLMQAAREQIDPGNIEFVFHATRHTHITRWAARGLELTALMDQAGHKTPSITMRYIHMTATSRMRLMQEAMDREARS